jgi:two-component system chemotaxis sensor kinase CheA
LRGVRELARATDLALAIRDHDLVQRAFGDYARSEDVVAIVAQDAESQLIAGHGVVPPGLVPFDGPALTLAESDAYLRAWATASIEGGTVGRVALVVSKRRLVQSERLLRRISLATGVAGGVMLLGGIFFVVFFTRAIAQRDQQLAGYASGLERRISERTLELDRINRGMRLVLDNVGQGFVTVSASGVMSAQRSAIVDRWLPRAGPGATLADAIRPHDPAAAEWLELGLEALHEGVLPIELLLAQLPARMRLEALTLRLGYQPIMGPDGVLQLLVILTDVTDEIVRERVERDSREMSQVFRRIGSDRLGFEHFFYEATDLVAQIVAGSNSREVERRLIHTLKGNAALYGVESVAQLCHQLENDLTLEERTISESERRTLHSEWTRVGELVGPLLGEDRAVIALEESDLRALLDAIRRGAGAAELTALVSTWRDEPVSVRLSALAEQARYLSRRLGKPEVLVHVESGNLRLNAKRWSAFWAAMVHAVANAVDHGIEDAATRRSRGKPERGQLWLAAQRDGRAIVISVRDDGGGIDWTRLAELAVARGLAHETREDLVAVMLADGVSTRDQAGETSGRGVGLAALLQATARMGGTIEVHSEPGRETRFVFRFDLLAIAASARPELSATQEIAAVTLPGLRT